MHKYTNTTTTSTINTTAQARARVVRLLPNKTPSLCSPIRTDILTKFNIGRRIFFQIMTATGGCVFCHACMHECVGLWIRCLSSFAPPFEFEWVNGFMYVCLAQWLCTPYIQQTTAFRGKTFIKPSESIKYEMFVGSTACVYGLKM